MKDLRQTRPTSDLPLELLLAAIAVATALCGVQALQALPVLAS